MTLGYFALNLKVKQLFYQVVQFLKNQAESLEENLGERALVLNVK
jgi:hypothetical protein